MKRVDEKFEYMSFKTTGLEMVACCFERQNKQIWYAKGENILYDRKKNMELNFNSQKDFDE